MNGVRRNQEVQIVGQLRTRRRILRRLVYKSEDSIKILITEIRWRELDSAGLEYGLVTHFSWHNNEYLDSVEAGYFLKSYVTISVN
jgi:hypothetical protein